MMKGMKKLLSVILCMTMVLAMGLAAVPASAVEDIQTLGPGKGSVQCYYWDFADCCWQKIGDPIEGDAGTNPSVDDLKAVVDAAVVLDSNSGIFGLNGANYTIYRQNAQLVNFLYEGSTSIFYGTKGQSTYTWKKVLQSKNVKADFTFKEGTEIPVVFYPSKVTVPVVVDDGNSVKTVYDTDIVASFVQSYNDIYEDYYEGPALFDKTNALDISGYTPQITLAESSNKFNELNIQKTDAQRLIYKNAKDNSVVSTEIVTSYKYADGCTVSLAQEKWFFNLKVCIESSFPVVINIAGPENIKFKSVNNDLSEKAFAIGSEIDLSTCKFTSDGKTAYTLSELLSSISDKNTKLQGLEIKSLYRAGKDTENLISEGNVKFTINDATDFINNYKAGDGIALYAKTGLKSYPVKVMYASKANPELNDTGSQPITDKVLVEKNITYSSTETVKITDDGLLDAVNGSNLIKTANDAIVGWTVDEVNTKGQSAVLAEEIKYMDKDGGIKWNVIYSHTQIPAFIDYNTDFESQKEKKIAAMGSGYTYHGQDLYETTADGLISFNVETLNFVTNGSYDYDEDGVTIKEDKKANASDNKPGRDYELIGYEVYFYDGTLTADQVANVDYSKLEKVSKDDEGKLLAEVGTTIIVKLLWKNSNDFLIKIYNTKGDLSIALGKNFKTYYWADNKPCKRSEIIKVSDPDKNYVCMYVPSIEKTHCDVVEGVATPTDNTKSVFALTMAMGTKSNLTIEGRFAFYKTLIDTIKSLIG